jgi:UDP-N-acetylglucosamine acyltransferase
MTQIHPTVHIDPTAVIGNNVSIGPYSCIGPNCTVADNVLIGPHVTLIGNTRVGEGCHLHSHAALGGDPQDLSYKGQQTWLELGKNVQIREFVTLHRGSTEGAATTIGDNCLLMTSVHVGHDSHLGNNVIIASSTVIAGHVDIGEHAFVSGLCAVHQHCRVGAYSMTGGVSATRQDIPPYCRAAGVPSLMMGLNSIGLRRHGIPSASRMALKRTYRLLWMQGLNTTHALELLEASEDGLDPYVKHLIDFVRTSKRGLVSHGREGFRSLEDPRPIDSLAEMVEASVQRVFTQQPPASADS